MQVSLSVSLSCDEAKRKKIIDGLTATLQKNGMTVADNQPTQLTVTEGTGNSREVTYRLIGRPVAEKTTVSEKKIDLTLVANGQAVWHRDLVAGIPSFIQMKKDQSVDQAVAIAQNSIYDGVDITYVPKFVPKPEAMNGIGKSDLTAKGPEPVGATP
jgi:hypothetical protein